MCLDRDTIPKYLVQAQLHEQLPGMHEFYHHSWTGQGWPHNNIAIATVAVATRPRRPPPILAPPLEHDSGGTVHIITEKS